MEHRGKRGLSIATLLAGVVLASGLARAADPDVVWVTGAGGPGHDKVRGVAADPQGNAYITGEFTGTAQFGKHTLTSRGLLDFFVAKYNRQGECLWVRAGGGTKTDRGYAVAVDKNQNCYVTGHYESTDARFGEDGPLPNRGDYDLFVAKYDRAGALKWTRTAGGPQYDYGHGIGLDGAGNCYVTGALSRSAEFGDLKTSEEEGSRMLLVKLSPTGKQVWAQASRGGIASGQGMTVDKAGNSWVTGDTSGEVDFAGVKHTITGADAVLVKFGPDGRGLWASGGAGDSGGIGTGISVDATGAAYLGGWFKTTLRLAGEEMKCAGISDVFAAKFDANGKALWARPGGGPGVDYCEGSVPDHRGGCYIVGLYHDAAVFDGVPRRSVGDFDVYLAHYDGAGKLLELQQAGGPGVDQGYCIARTGKRDAYISGAFAGTSPYDGKSVTSAGSNDVLLLKVRLK